MDSAPETVGMPDDVVSNQGKVYELDSAVDGELVGDSPQVKELEVVDVCEEVSVVLSGYKFVVLGTTGTTEELPVLSAASVEVVEAAGGDIAVLLFNWLKKSMNAPSALCKYHNTNDARNRLATIAKLT